MDGAFDLHAVHADSHEVHANEYSAGVATSSPPPLVSNVEGKLNTLRFLEVVITIDADKCRLWHSVAHSTENGGAVLTGPLMIPGGTTRIIFMADVLIGLCYP